MSAGPVPFTLQTFAVFVTAALLGTKRGTIAVVVYILLGIIGVPVFAGLTGGPSVIAGPTGGFIATASGPDPGSDTDRARSPARRPRTVSRPGALRPRRSPGSRNNPDAASGLRPDNGRTTATATAPPDRSGARNRGSCRLSAPPGKRTWAAGSL